MKFNGVALVVSFVALVACKEDPNTAASDLLSKAKVSFDQLAEVKGYSTESMKERESLLNQSIGNIDTILSEYPSSEIAVDLASKGEANGISLSKLKSKRDSVKREVVCRESSETCDYIALVYFDEKSRPVVPKRRMAVIYFLAANGRWLDAVAMLDGFEDRDEKFNAGFQILNLGVIYGSPDNLLVLGEMPPDTFPYAGWGEGFLAKGEEPLRKGNWKRTGSIKEQPHVGDWTAGDWATERLDSISDIFESGDIGEIQDALSSAFMKARYTAEESGSTDLIYSEFVEKVDQESGEFFRSLD